MTPTLFVVCSRDAPGSSLGRVGVDGASFRVIDRLPRVDRARPPLLQDDAERVARILTAAHRHDGRRFWAEPLEAPKPSAYDIHGTLAEQLAAREAGA
jgi:hypothetical protein